MTFLCASIIVDNESTALAAAQNAATFGADLIEWRVDLCAHDHNLIGRLITQSPLPTIITCRPTTQGGLCEPDELDEQTRHDLFDQLLSNAGSGGAGPSYIDLETHTLTQPLPHHQHTQQSDAVSFRDLLNTNSAVRIIASLHDYKARPKNLHKQLNNMLDIQGCDVLKIAWQARSVRDNLEAFELLKTRSKPMTVICMGVTGLMSRILAPKFGGFLTFAAVNKEQGTAPGQPTINELIKLYRFKSITPETKVYGVIGWPIEQSRSPHIHNAAFTHLDYNGVYLPIPIPPGYEHFKATLSSFIEDENLDFYGASITHPHKHNLIRFVQEHGGIISPDVKQIGAANTLVIHPDKSLEIVNTDRNAVVDSAIAAMNITTDAITAKHITILGSGGMARAAAAGFAYYGAHITIVSRNTKTANELTNALASFTQNNGQPTHPVRTLNLDDALQSKCDLCIHATPLGMTGSKHENESPISAQQFQTSIWDNAVILDTVYIPNETPLQQAAQQTGLQTIPGSDMFLRQAVMQSNLWTKKHIDISIMQTAL